MNGIFFNTQEDPPPPNQNKWSTECENIKPKKNTSKNKEKQANKQTKQANPKQNKTPDSKFRETLIRLKLFEFYY